MNDTKGLSAEILGQISLMQSVVAQLPEKTSILNFVCRGLVDVSGVERVEYILPGDESDEEQKSGNKDAATTRVFPVVCKGDTYATLIFHLAEPGQFFPYIPFIENFVQMLGVIFEEKRQSKLNREIQADLERLVMERARELEARAAVVAPHR